MWPEVASAIGQIIDYDRIVITKLDMSRSLGTALYIAGVQVEGSLPGDHHPVDEYSIAGRLAKFARPILATSESLVELTRNRQGEAQRRAAGLRSLLAVPLLWQSEVVGTLNLRSQTENAYDDNDIALAEQVAAQIVGAVVALDIHERALTEVTERSALATVARITSSAQTLKEIGDQVSRQVRALVECNYVSIQIYDPDQDHFVIAYVSSDRAGDDLAVGDIEQARGSVHATVVDERKPATIGSDNLDEWLQKSPQLQRYVDLGLTRGIIAAMVSNDRVIGIFAIADFDGPQYRPDQSEFVQNVADQIAPVIDNIRLRTELETELAQRELLAKIGRAVNQSIEVNEVFELLAAELLDVIPHDRLAISNVDYTENTFISGVRVDGLEVGQQVVEFPALPSLSPIGSAVIEAITSDSSHPVDQALFRSGLRSRVRTVLGSSDDPLGFLAVMSRQVDAFTEDDAMLIGQICTSVGPTVKNAREHSEMLRLAAEQHVLTQISEIISSSQTIESVFDRIGDLISGILPCDRMFISTLLPGNAEVLVRHTWGIDCPERRVGTVYPISGTTLDTILETGGPLLVDDINMVEISANLPRAGEAPEHVLRSLVAVPLISNGRTIGMFGVRSVAENVYNDNHIEQATRIAAHIAGEIEKDELNSQLRHETAEQQVLLQISEIISSSLNIEDVFDQIAEAIAEILSCDRMFISTLLPGKTEGVIRHAWGVKSPDFHVGKKYTIFDEQLGIILETGKPLLIGEHNVDEMSTKLARLTQELEAGLRSYVTVPLISEGRVIGLFGVRSTSVDAYTGRHVELATRIATHIAGQIEKDELNSQLRLEAAEQQVLMKISEIISSSLNIEDVFDQIAEAISGILQSDRMFISTTLPGGSEAVVLHAWGLESPDFFVGTRYPVADSQIRKVLETGKPLLIGEHNRDELVTSISRLKADLANGLISHVTVPLTSNGRTIGVFGVRSFSVDAYTDRHLELATRIATHIAGEIEKDELNSQLRLRAAEQQALAEIGRAVSQNLDIDELYDRLADELAEIIPYDRLALSTWGPERSKLVFIRGREVPGLRIGDSFDMALHVSPEENDRSILLAGELGSVQASLVESGLNSRIQMLIGPEDAPISIMALLRDSELGFTHDEEVLLKQVANQIAPAIANATEHEASLRLAKELSESEIRYRELYDNAPDMLISFDSGTGNIIQANQTALDEFGYSHEEFTGLHREKIIHPDSLEQANEAESEIMASGFVVGAELRVLRADGSDLIVSIDATAVRDSRGRITGSQAIWRDITEDVQLRTSFERAQNALDSTTDMVSIHDADTMYIYVNDAWVAGTGYPRDEIIGHFPPIQDDFVDHQSAGSFWDIAKSGQVWSNIIPNHRKDGTLYYEQATLSPVFGESGEITGFVVIKRDITDRLEAESLISQSLARQDLISIVEHELRSPLAAIINFVDLLRKSENRRPEIIDALKSTTSELASTINDLRDVSSNAAAHLSVDRKTNNLATLLSNAIARATDTVEKKQLNLHVTISEDRATVVLEVDASRMTQVFSNLITNAVRYSPAGSSIEIELGQSGSFTSFRIYNEGAGVTAGELEMVTHPYFRGASSRNSPEPGSGIGLALSSAIVESHGGHMNIRSEPGEFFEVEVLLPNPNLN